MRKLAWFVIIVFGLVLAVALACAVSPDVVGKSVSSMLLSAGDGILGGVHAGIQSLANTVSVNVTYFVIYTCIVLATGGVFWIGVKRLFKKPIQKVTTLVRGPTASIREEPRDIIMTENSAPTATTKKKEVTPSEPVAQTV